MRTAILLLCAASFGVACAAAPGPAVAATAIPLPVKGAAIASHQAELRLDVIELTCHSCAGQVAEGTARIPGVLHVSAAILEHTLVVSYDPTRLTENALVAAIDRVVDSVAQ